jgi:hypothetical protein
VAREPREAAEIRTHSCATTTPGVRLEIQASEEKNVVLAQRYGVNRKTIAKWKARDSTSDERMGPKIPPSRRLSHKDEAIILAYRWRTRLGLNDAHFRLKRLMPKLSRSMLYRCLKRHRLSRIGSTATCPALTAAALGGPYTFEITIQEVTLHDADDAIGLLYPVFLAVEQITKDVYAEVATPTPENAAAFLERLIAKSPQKIIAVTTDVNPIFVDWRASFDEEMAVGPHPFAVACRARGLVHWRSRPPSTKPLKIDTRGVDIR